ncbi:Acyl-coenzyme A oxidase [Flavobacterium segetis]|uniref:acyl-CoA oxidase n=1 Tax=Flavobacterium segetis TaxID=271157 RepID=A0A1M5I8Z4_9FLAO|nr:acyl-CoA dehydrogenase [Flavobacterium segetis]SHG24263.1 Acyl-coenzyme A oxidase [Flavobacterium segetis]
MENTKLKVFIPFLYLVWSDDLLTQKEHLVLKKFISVQNWLKDDEKVALISQLSISNAPSRFTMTNWKSEINTALEHNPEARSLFDIVIELSNNGSAISEFATNFIQLENDLGILGEDVISNFKKNVITFTSTHQSDPTFEISKLTQILDGEQSEIIQKVKSIITRPEFAYETSTDTAIYREKVYQWCKILARENLGNMAYPKKYGGGENIADYFAIMETLSYHDLSLVIKFGVQFGLWGMSIHSLGTEKHYQKYLKDIGTLKLPGCFAMTETNHGSNVKGLETTATYNHQNKTFVINTPHEKAQKEYIGNAAIHGQMATVFAKLIINEVDYGVNAFVVPLRNQNNQILNGIIIKDCGLKMGLNGVDNGTISFDNVIIPKDNMLDRFASVNEQGKFESPIPSDNRRFFTMLGTLVGGRIGIPRSALAAAKSGLTIAIQYSDKRKQFGPEGGEEVSILNYRMHQRRLFPLLAKTYAIHFALQYVTNRFIKRTDLEMPEIEALAAGMKAYSTWNTTATLQECREACGGKGYLSENRIGVLKSDTEIYTTFEGDNTVLMQLVAKNRLSEFRKTYGKMDAMGIISYVYENTKTVIAEKNPIITRKTDEAHLLDATFHLSAFEYREKTILASAAKRLKKLIDGGLEPYDAFNVVQHQMIDVAQAYLDRVVLEQFIIAIDKFEDSKSKDIVNKLSQLYALSLLDKNKGWYLEDGYLEAIKTKAIRKMVNQLCWELRPEAISLVKAFAIPDSCLSAPIAL